MISLFQAMVLGVLQGLTEFLPISSSAHLILVRWFFGWPDAGLAFDVFLHMGTLLALFLYFFGELKDLAGGGISSILERRVGYEKNRRLFWIIALGTVPAVIAALFFGKYAETTFRESPLLIAATLAFVGFLIAWVDSSYPTLRNFEEVGFWDSLWIGIAQAFAIIPGVSRSGATIGMARRLGLNRESAAKFSFLLSVPIIMGAGLYESKGLIEALGDKIDWWTVAVGFFSAFFSGLIAIHFMLIYLRNADLMKFTWYRVILALVIVVWSLTHSP